MQKEVTQKFRWLKYLGKKQAIVGLAFVVLIGLLKYFHVTDCLSLSFIQQHLDTIAQQVKDHYWVSVLIFMGSYTLASALSLPGSSFFLTTAGLLYGLFPGVLYAIIAATIGGTILFLTARYVIGDWVQRRYAQQLARYNKEIEKHGASYLLLMRFIALVPFFTVNILSGLTLLRTRDFIWATFLGLIPVSAVFAFAGQQLSRLGCEDNFFSPPVIVAFVVLVLFKLTLVPVAYMMYKRRRAGADA